AQHHGVAHPLQLGIPPQPRQPVHLRGHAVRQVQPPQTVAQLRDRLRRPEPEVLLPHPLAEGLVPPSREPCVHRGGKATQPEIPLITHPRLLPSARATLSNPSRPGRACYDPPSREGAMRSALQWSLALGALAFLLVAGCARKEKGHNYIVRGQVV